MNEIIDEIISEFHHGVLPEIIERQLAVPVLPANVRKALVFIGMRRAGKTYLMYQRMAEALAAGLEKEKLLYLNFEDDRLKGFSVGDFQSVLDVYFERYPALAHRDDLLFFFDEIQNIPGWEQFIRRLIDKERMAIFVTGSSATLLSKEIASSLRGRCLATEVFPLSFREYLGYRGVSQFERLSQKQRATVRHHAKEYLTRGGFPETLDLTDNLHTSVLQSYVEAAVFRDVIERHQLGNIAVVKLFLLHCLQHIAAPLSVTKVHGMLKSRGEAVGRNSLYEYLTYFEDAYLIFLVSVYELSTRKRQVNPNKVYCVDTGIISVYSIKTEVAHAARLENAVYLGLRQQGFENIFYYKTVSGFEIDFLAQRPNGEGTLTQVCVDLKSEETRLRELRAIVEAANELGMSEAWVVTTDYGETVTEGAVTIHIVPYDEWILEEWPGS